MFFFFQYVYQMLSRIPKLFCVLKGVLHLWALFLKTLCIFSKNKATLDKASYGSDQKCSKELKHHSFYLSRGYCCEVTEKYV